MKLPNIQGRKKIRDAKVCMLWANDNMSTSEISEKMNLTQRRVQQILKRNKEFVGIDPIWEKRKMIYRLDREINAKQKSYKDLADLIEYKRKLIDGDSKVNVDNSQHKHYTVIWEIDGKSNSVQATREPGCSLDRQEQV